MNKDYLVDPEVWWPLCSWALFYVGRNDCTISLDPMYGPLILAVHQKLNFIITRHINIVYVSKLSPKLWFSIN